MPQRACSPIEEPVRGTDLYASARKSLLQQPGDPDELVEVHLKLPTAVAPTVEVPAYGDKDLQEAKRLLGALLPWGFVHLNPARVHHAYQILPDRVVLLEPGDVVDTGGLIALSERPLRLMWRILLYVSATAGRRALVLGLLGLTLASCFALGWWFGSR